ncbi:MAG: hypothetical protein FWF80_03315 [Defluviitaleaceae bacterium]|nr:hypothetical protein [Defluviitaleaceae bacterium]
MKRMNNAHEEARQSLKERVLCKVSNMFAEMGVNPRGCWGGIIHELELPPEVIAENLKNAEV